MKRDIVEIFLKERIKENRELFDKSELSIIKNNFKIFKKIYIMGLLIDKK